MAKGPVAPNFKMKSRMLVVLAGMVLVGFGLVLHQLFKLQVVEAEDLQNLALGQQLRPERISAKRGTIYDTNNKELAVSATVWTVCVSPNQIKGEETEDVKKRNATIKALVEVLELDEQYVRDKVENNLDKYYVAIKTKVDKPLKDKLSEYIDQNQIRGIFYEEDTRRYYPYDNLASTVLGFTNSDNIGAYGLESYYEKTLAGTPGVVLSLRNSRGIKMPLQYEQSYQAQDGNSLVLTIDEKLQHYLEKHLEIAVAEHKVENRAVGIIMNVKTGEILAMASKPDFDPNNPYEIQDQRTLDKLEEEKEKMEKGEISKEEYQKTMQDARYAQWRNKAISDPYEPGSVFKIVTLAAGLESGTSTKNSSFYCPGWRDVAGKQVHCWIWGSRHEGHGQQNLTDAVKNSCNPAFIDIGQNMGSSTFFDYFSNFGLTKKTGIDLPGESAGQYYSKENMGISQLSSASFGQTFTVTPIQLMTACNAAVNGGNLMQPYIVKQVLDPSGNVVSSTEPVVKRQVVSEEISQEVALILEQVVGGGGSGKQAKIPGYRIGGKTGTSEKLDLLNKTGVKKNILSFYGFGPVEDPEIACLVLLDEPDLVNAYGSTVAAPVVGAILADVLPAMGIQPSYTEEELTNTVTSTPLFLDQPIHEAQSIARDAGLKIRIVGNGTKVLRQVPGYQVPITSDTTVVLYTEEEEEEQLVEVPNVVGKTASEANSEITNAGLEISLVGSGMEGSQTVAVSQNPTAGEMVPKGTIIEVNFMGRSSEEEETP